jgi:hypothetical protein
MTRAFIVARISGQYNRCDFPCNRGLGSWYWVLRLRSRISLIPFPHESIKAIASELEVSRPYAQSTDELIVETTHCYVTVWCSVFFDCIGTAGTDCLPRFGTDPISAGLIDEHNRVPNCSKALTLVLGVRKRLGNT